MYVVVGAGFSGAVAARELAERYREKVIILEKRAHIGGNMQETFRENGVRVHQYGPHLFHTNNHEVYEYLQHFSDFYPYEHRVLGKINGVLVPIPFNFTSLRQLFPAAEAKEIIGKLKKLYPNQKKISILELLKAKDVQIRNFGGFVFEKVFVHYTAKQWNQPIEEVDTSVIDRVPVVLGEDDRYFQDAYQAMPSEGYNKIFEQMLNSPRIEVRLDCDAIEHLELKENGVFFDGIPLNGQVIYTGALDDLLGHKYGFLPYRSLDFVFEDWDCISYQPASVVNYPNEESFTRITEFKKLTGQQSDKTTILKEYPQPYDPRGEKGNIPYYPILSDQNKALYEKYLAEINKFPQIHLCGRLAEYRYYNMDGAIERALRLVRELEGE